MGYYCNVTFVMAPGQEAYFLDWMRGECIPALFNAESAARTPVLNKVIAHGGEPTDPSHGLSIALQAEFQTVEALDGWAGNELAAAVGEFRKRFGKETAVFTTTLESLGL